MLGSDELLHPGLLKPYAVADRLALSVGGPGFVLTSDDPHTRFSVDEPSQLFLGEPREDVLRFRVERGDLSGPRPGPVLFDAAGSWILRRDPGGDFVYDLFTPLNPAGPYRSARVREDYSGGEIILHAPYYAGVEEVDPLRFPLAELLLNRRLARKGGVELHACGILDEEGRGFLFAGRSGDGKTTTARLWNDRPGITVLSDDRILLSRTATGYRMQGTPWHGEATFAVNASAPLEALFLLEHGPETKPIPITGSEVVAGIMPRCFPPYYDRPGLESVLETLFGVANSLPCYRFPFVPEQAALDVVRRTVSAARAANR